MYYTLFSAKLEAKLLAMQKRLAQIAQIPGIIQSTLESVSRTFDEFLPNYDNKYIDGEDIADDIISLDSLDHYDDNNLTRNIDQDIVKDIETQSQDDDVDQINDEKSEIEDANSISNENEALTDFSLEPTPEPEPTEEQLLKIEKQNKVN